jgi:hypothetical protein
MHKPGRALRAIWSLTIFLSVIILFGGCNNDDPDPVFRLDYEIIIEPPAGLNVFETHFFRVRNIRTRVQQAANEAGVSLEEVVAIRTSSSILSSSFQGGNIAIIDEAVVDIYSPFTPEDRYEAAYTIQVPFEPVNSIQMVGSPNDLKQVMLNAEFTLELGLRFRSTTQASLPLRLRITMDAFM